MNNLNNVISFVTGISPWFVVKIVILVFLVMYFIFAAVLSRQVTLMNQVLEARFSPVLKLIALIQVLAVAAVFLISLVYL